MYIVKRFPYCGLSMPPVVFETESEAREYTGGLLARLRRKFPVQTLERGKSWEVCEPDGAMMVPDQCGTITLRRETFECRECGSLHDTPEQSRECCAAYFADEEYDNED